MENKGELQELPVISEELQIAMMNFFLKTSVPRILKQQNSENEKIEKFSNESDFNMKGSKNDK